MDRSCTDGKILRIDLSTGEIIAEPAIELITKFLGGRGINHWLLLTELNSEISPFDPESMLMFGTGALSGTLAPGSGRINISAKNPLTGGIGSGSAGGFLAPELRFAGYDTIVVTGKAQRPSFIWIHNDHVEIKNASHLWGKGTWETENALKEELPESNVQVAVIGPAGENLVAFSCIVVSTARVVGRCGLGAVMGSKNLKAVAVKGTGHIALRDKKAFAEISHEMFLKLGNSEVLQRTKHFGTVKAFTPFRPVNNYQDEYVDAETFGGLHHEVFKQIYEREKYPCCFNCPINCGRMYEVTDGVYAGTISRKLEANALSDFGPKLGIYDAAAMVKLQGLCDQYGLDMDNTAGTIAWAMECFQRKILSKNDLDGLALEWGNHQAVVSLVHKIAFRKGVGDLLADGCKKAAEQVGSRSEPYCMHIKGQALMESMRPYKAWALGVVVSERGAGHTRGAPLSDLKGISSEAGEKLWGVPEASDPTLYAGKAKIVVYYEQFHSVLDSLGICSLTSNWADPVLPSPDDYARLLSAATELNCTSDELMRIGEKIHTIGKAFNMIHAGFSRKDDYPPLRLMEEPIKKGAFKGEQLKKKDWDRLLDDYYLLHQWDKETGWCTENCLKSQDLSEVVGILRDAGKIPD